MREAKERGVASSRGTGGARERPASAARAAARRGTRCRSLERRGDERADCGGPRRRVDAPPRRRPRAPPRGERRAAPTPQETEAERLRALGQLAAGVAHDFNNALTAVLGYVDAMRRRLDDPEFIARGLDVIEQASRGAAATVRRIQTFARERDSAELRPLDLNVAVQEAVDMSRSQRGRDAGAVR